jgi:hypothetical protein
MMSSAAWADDDSSADAQNGFVSMLGDSKGIILRVAINEAGEENTNATEVRVVTSAQTSLDAAQAQTIWNNATQTNSNEVLDGHTIPLDQDSSTFGWYRWNNIGWRYPYYYSSYYPTYYYGGNYWRYNYYWNYSYPGYRYYYYYWY